MFILVMLTQHVSSTIMLIIRNTDYIKTACGMVLETCWVNITRI